MSIAKEFVASVDRGVLSEAEAQQRATSVLRGIRFGKNDYIFVYRDDGQNIVLGPRPEMEGKNLLENKDPNGVPYVRELIAAATRNDGSFVSYMFPRAGSDKPAAKMGYALGVAPWKWVIGTGVYVSKSEPRTLPNYHKSSGLSMTNACRNYCFDIAHATSPIR